MEVQEEKHKGTITSRHHKVLYCGLTRKPMKKMIVENMSSKLIIDVSGGLVNWVDKKVISHVILYNYLLIN